MSSQSTYRTYFIFSSSIFHAGLLILALMVELPKIKHFERIEIQVGSSAPIEAPLISQAETAPQIQAPAQQEEKAPEVIAPKMTKMAPVAKALPAKALDTKLDSSDLEKSLNAPAAALAATDMNDSDMTEDLDRVDQETAQALQSKSNLAEADDVMKESEVLAQQAHREQELKSQALAKEAAQRRAQEKQSMEKMFQAHALALASEQAQQRSEEDQKRRAEKALMDQKLAEEEARYEAAKAAALVAAQETAAQKEREEQGAQMATASSGTSVQHVRSLEDIKQMPGNQHPAYSEDDRLTGRKGNVIYDAYVSAEGTPTQFKMVQSSGHKTLDEKTLKAIQDWKFVPGQEGWVEIPFQWDLKGDAKVIRGTLRKVSQK